MFNKMFLSNGLCERAEKVARAYAAHDDGKFNPRGEWFIKALQAIHDNNEVKEVYPRGRMFSDAVFLCLASEVSKVSGNFFVSEFEEFDCD
jgi:hypothetical protein